MKTRRTRRWTRRILIPLSLFPMLATTGCTDSLGTTITSMYIQSINAVLLETFPSADILQTLLGGNPKPFFP